MIMRIVISIIFIAVFSSCASLNIYTGEEHAKNNVLLDTTVYRPVIQVDDKISISIWNHTDLSVGSVFGIYNSNEVFGKWLLVSKDSTVFLPKVGKVKLGGKSIDEAKEVLTVLYRDYIKNPILDMKIHSHEVTVIGQVIKPGNYPIFRGNNSLSYLIGEAGGTDFYAKLNKVTLARGDVTYLLDLTELTPIEMNRINLLPGDVLYFPTRSGKSLDKKAPIILAAASITTTLILLFSAIGK
jgi:polysaccharide export outer membrane protein